MVAICSRIGDRLKSMNLSLLKRIDWKGDESCFDRSFGVRILLSSITFDDTLSSLPSGGVVQTLFRLQFI